MDNQDFIDFLNQLTDNNTMNQISENTDLTNLSNLSDLQTVYQMDDRMSNPFLMPIEVDTEIITSPDDGESNFSFCTIMLLVILGFLICKLLNKFNIIESFTNTILEDKGNDCIAGPFASEKKQWCPSTGCNGLTQKDIDDYNNVKSGKYKPTGYTTGQGHLACSNNLY